MTTGTRQELGPFQAELAWPATFEADGLPVSKAVALLQGALCWCQATQ